MDLRYEQQCLEGINASMDLSAFEGKTIFVTGATGLIGKMIIKALITYVDNVKLYALVRSQERAAKAFEGYDISKIDFIVGDVETFDIKDMGIDYIIHGASVTDSKAFVERPREIILTAVNGTQHVLELAKANPIKMMAYLSTMEIYGCPPDDRKISEDSPSYLDSMSTRSCYPESKRMGENLCVSANTDSGIPVCSVRLTQTFGPGVRYDDNRVFAQFARCSIEKTNIILKTLGKTKRCYLYLGDAVTAILTVLLKGQSGLAYNAANEATYCSIYEMAELVADEKSGIEVEVRLDESGNTGYAPTLCMNLDTSRLQGLGWSPRLGLKDMFNVLIEDMKINR